MKTIGIIGGSTEVATVEYYRLINSGIRNRLGGLHTGEIIINSMDFAQSDHFVHNGLWDEGGAYLNGKALGLERAGAEFILCVSNTWYRAATAFMTGVKIPLLHIVDPTAEAIRASGLTKVALLGTKATMSETFLIKEYTERFGIEILVPEEENQDVIDRIIFKELSQNIFTEESRNYHLAVIDTLSRKGAQGVILGCTEIPLLVHQGDRPNIPMFNTLELHANAAINLALES